MNTQMYRHIHVHIRLVRMHAYIHTYTYAHIYRVDTAGLMHTPGAESVHAGHALRKYTYM